MHELIWVIAYTNKDYSQILGYVDDPDFFFISQEDADQAKPLAFIQLVEQGLVIYEDQLRAVPMAEIDVEDTE